MDYFIRFIPLGVLAILFACVGIIRWFFLKKGNSVKIDDKVIKQPNEYLWLCSIGLIFYVCIALMCVLFPSADDGGRLPGIIALVVLTAITGIPLMVLLIFSFNWKITLGEDSFEYRNMFRKTRKYHYADINIKQMKASTRFYKGNKRIVTVSYLIDNYDALQIAVRKYQSTHKRKQASD